MFLTGFKKTSDNETFFGRCTTNGRGEREVFSALLLKFKKLPWFKKKAQWVKKAQLLNEYLGEKTPALITVFFFVCSRRNVHWSIHILRNFPCPKTFLVVHLNTISLDVNITGHCDESTRIAVFPLVSISGAYFILKFQGAVVIRGRHLKEGGAYFKVRQFIHIINYSR